MAQAGTTTAACWLGSLLAPSDGPDSRYPFLGVAVRPV